MLATNPMPIQRPPRRARRFATRLALTALLALGASLGRAADLIVSGAASLTNAFRALGPMYEAQNPGAKVLFNFAASDALLAQIAKGAPADVFAAADQESMDRAEAQQLLRPGSRRDFVSNTLVLATPSDSTLNVQSLADLRRPDVRHVALGAPASVPAGRYAKVALEAARLWPVVEAKAVYAQSVRQALDYLARGEADAGFVYATDAAVMKEKVRVAATVPTGTPILYPIASVAGGPNPVDAAKFAAFVATPAAQAVLARFGFGKP